MGRSAPFSSVVRALERIGVDELGVSSLDVVRWRAEEEVYLYLVDDRCVDGADWGVPEVGSARIHWVGNGEDLLGRLAGLPANAGWQAFLEVFPPYEWHVTQAGQQRITGDGVRRARRRESREAGRQLAVKMRAAQKAEKSDHSEGCTEDSTA